MTPQRRRQIGVALYKAGASTCAIGRLLSVDSSTVWYWLNKTDTPRRPRVVAKDKSLRGAFERRVVRRDGCWGWKTSSRNTHGYIQIRWEGKHVLAHRLSWELFNEQAIPSGMCVLHECDNPECTNPEHLFLGTQQDNIADMAAKGRAWGWNRQS